MAGRVPARREVKKKPKATSAKPHLESLLDSPRSPWSSSSPSGSPGRRRKTARSSRGPGRRWAFGATHGGGPGMTITGGNGAATGTERSSSADRNGADRAAERLVAERGKAVDAAILSIEKQFGRGSIMKLGSSDRQSGGLRSRPVPSPSTWHWASAACRAAASRRSSARSRRARPPSASTSSRRRSDVVAWSRSSTSSTRSTRQYAPELRRQRG